MEVIAVAGHDTRAPWQRSRPAKRISCLSAAERGGCSERSLRSRSSAKCQKKFNITNEAGLEGKIRILKEYHRSVADSGEQKTVDTGRKGIRIWRTGDEGRLHGTFKSLINPDAPEFVPAGDIPERIRQFCQKNGAAGSAV